MKISLFRITLRRRIYGGAVGVTAMIVALAAIASVQFERLGLETGRLSADTNLYMGLTSTLEKATEIGSIPSRAASGGATLVS